MSFDYYVSPTGTDDAPGTLDAPLSLTGLMALGSAAAGKRVSLGVAGDEYRGMLTVPADDMTFGSHNPFDENGARVGPRLLGTDPFIGAWTEEMSSAEDFTDDTGMKPVSWWMFEENGTPSADGNTASGNDLNWDVGTARTATHVEGSYGLAVPASAAGASRPFASLSSGFPFKGTTTGFTLSGWFYFANAPATFANFFTLTNGSSQGFRLQTSAATGGIRGVVYSAGGTATINSAGTPVAAGGWVHVGLRWNGENRTGAGGNDEVSLWINGAKESSTLTRTSVALVTASSLLIMGNGGGGVQVFDELAVFDVALTDAELASLYAHGLTGTRGGGPTGVWSTPAASGKVYPRLFVVDDTKCEPCLNRSDLTDATYRAWWDSAAERHYIATEPGLDPNDATVEATSTDRQYCVYATGRSGLVVRDVEMRWGHHSCLRSTATAGPITVERTRSIGAGVGPTVAGDGILIYGAGFGGTPVPAPGVVVRHNVGEGNLNNAVELWGVTGAVVEDNTGDGNGGGIELWGHVSDSAFRRNDYRANDIRLRATGSPNAGRGFWAASPAQEAPNTGTYSNNLLEYNVFGDCRFSGIQLDHGTGWRLRHNTVAGSAPSNGSLLSEGTDVEIAEMHNNIFAATTGSTGRTVSLGETTGAVTITASDHNLFYRHDGAAVLWLNGASLNLAAWQAATSGDAASVEADPELDDDYRPGPGSPAIGAASDGGTIGALEAA